MDYNLKLQVLTSELNYNVKEVATDYCNVFCEDESRLPIRGFSFHIDKGKNSPICCKPPRYVLYESEVILKVVVWVIENFVVVEDGGPWGALVVISTKPHQEKVP